MASAKRRQICQIIWRVSLRRSLQSGISFCQDNLAVICEKAHAEHCSSLFWQRSDAAPHYEAEAAFLAHFVRLYRAKNEGKPTHFN
jgi:hypothetical protein